MLNPFLGIILNASFKYPLSWAHDMHIMNTYNHCTVLCEDFENSIWKSQPQVSIWGRAIGECGCANSGHSFPLSKALLCSCGPPRTLQWSWGLKSLNRSSGPLYKLYAYVCPMQSALYAVTNRYIFLKGITLILATSILFQACLGLMGPKFQRLMVQTVLLLFTLENLQMLTMQFNNHSYPIRKHLSCCHCHSLLTMWRTISFTFFFRNIKQRFF